MYRIKLHKACYELGTRVSKIGRIVHIIDRNIIRSWNDKKWVRNEAIRAYSELSCEHYDITLPNIYLRKSGQFNTSQIQYVAVSNQPPPVEGFQVICSVKSVRW